MRGHTAVTGLKIISLLAIAAGLAGAAYGFYRPQEVPLFVFAVPSWAIGLSAAYLGLRYWRRIPELQRNIAQSNGFSWSNFPVPRRRRDAHKT